MWYTRPIAGLAIWLLTKHLWEPSQLIIAPRMSWLRFTARIAMCAWRSNRLCCQGKVLRSPSFSLSFMTDFRWISLTWEPCPNRKMMGSLWTEQTVPNKHPQTFRVLEYLTFTLQEAWDNGNLARNHSILSGWQRIEYNFLFSMLTCGEYCFPHAKTLISVEDRDYLTSNRSTNRWYDGVFISSFVQLAAHSAHITALERLSVLDDSYKQPLLLHVTYPN